MSPTSTPNRERHKERSAESAPTDAKVVPLTRKIRKFEEPEPICVPTDTEDTDPGPSAA